MTKADIVLALITGGAVAWLFGTLASGIEFLAQFASFFWIFYIVFPIASLVGLWIAYLIGKKFLFVFQAAKFVLVGVWATLVDLGGLNLLFWAFGLPDAALVKNAFKGISFLVATFAKYFGDKFWAFEKKEREGMGKELTQFYIVTLIGLGINVGIFSLLSNTLGPQFGFQEKIWQTVSALFAALMVAVWNFLGYKFIVFKK